MKQRICFFFLLCSFSVFGQNILADSCKLNIGTNLSGLSDYGTEIPFVDLMHMSRTWYTKSIGDPNSPFDSGFSSDLSYRPDGYPVQIPQNIVASEYPQRVCTIWAITDAWPAGEYTILWEGEGDFSLWGGYENLEQTDDHRITFDFLNPVGNILELCINESSNANPIRNIRILMPGMEQSYDSDPFYSLWLEKLSPFQTLRFMDWGQTNNWGQPDPWTIGDGSLTDWDGRSTMEFYTWTHNKGVPYEMIVQLLNETDRDGWVCIPHVASEDYIREMSRYFRDNLEDDRHIYIEYSNEIWNWIFGQAQWTNEYGSVIPGETWPEGTVKYIQRVMDIWTEEFTGQLNRITRVVGVQAGWQDVAERVAFNVVPESFDAVSPTYYFGLSEESDQILDNLGTSAEVHDVVDAARDNMLQSFSYIEGIQTIVDSLNKRMVFYEGGQHITAHPFGEEPSYAQALIDVHRDTAMYNLYAEWFNLIRTLQVGEDPLLLMNFSFVGARSARYGSWGILETMDQDTSLIPAPKYQAVIDNMNLNCMPTNVQEKQIEEPIIVIVPNPGTGLYRIQGIREQSIGKVLNLQGQILLETEMNSDSELDLSFLPSGVYFIHIQMGNQSISVIRKFIKL